MGRVLFEQPLWLIAALVPVQVFLLIAWRARRTPLARRAAAVPVLLAGVLLLLGWLVVTDREKITRAYEAIAADVSAGRTDVLASYLAADVRVSLEPDDDGHVLDVAGAISTARRYTEQMKLREVKLSRLDIAVSGGQADTKVTTTILNDWSETAGAPIVLSWRVMWARRSDGWRIVHVRPIAAPGVLRAD